MYHLIFRRKHELNVVNLSSTQSFPSFEEVVLLFFQLHILGAVKLQCYEML